LDAQVLTRRDLYELVWQEPMTKLAKKFGLSDVGLAKLLKKHDIPRPPRGHWAKLQFGHKPKRTPLPNPKDNVEFIVHEFDEAATVAAAPPTEVEAELSRWQGDDSAIRIAKTLRGAHPLVSQAREGLQSAAKSDVGFLIRPEGSPLGLHVTRGTLRRALLMLDALLKAFEKQGYYVGTGPTVMIFGVDVAFRLDEMTEPQRQTVDEHDLEGPYRFGHSRFREKHVPSGRLALQITTGNAYWSQGSRKTWRDGKSPLEKRLLSFVEGVVRFAAILKKHKEECEREAVARQAEAERRAEAARQRAEKLKLIKAERIRVRELLATAKNWQRSQALRAYIDAAIAIRTGPDAAEATDPSFAEWVAWATEQADRLDPFVESPPSILVEAVRETELTSHWGTQGW
jgi:hypothetical protein